MISQWAAIQSKALLRLVTDQLQSCNSTVRQSSSLGHLGHLGHLRHLGE